MKQKRRSVDQAVIADAIEGAVAPSSAVAVASASAFTIAGAIAQASGLGNF